MADNAEFLPITADKTLKVVVISQQEQKEKDYLLPSQAVNDLSQITGTSIKADANFYTYTFDKETTPYFWGVIESDLISKANGKYLYRCKMKNCGKAMLSYINNLFKEPSSFLPLAAFETVKIFSVNQSDKHVVYALHVTYLKAGITHLNAVYFKI
ncbi:hypothetical protein [Aliikangiella maris]|uniref:Uncharacterized protein n=2 Tax=Aliikangiella maris TaxID=3162458 RepID=A0ABV2BU49_9GAMM